MKVTNILLSTTAIAAGCVKASATPASHVAEPADVRPLPSVNRPVVGHRNGTRGVVAMAVEARDKRKSQHHNHCAMTAS
jgi:hypothetical protein